MWRATVAGAGGGSRHTAASWRLGIPGGSVAHSLPSGACGARSSPPLPKQSRRWGHVRGHVFCETSCAVGLGVGRVKAGKPPGGRHWSGPLWGLCPPGGREEPWRAACASCSPRGRVVHPGVAPGVLARRQWGRNQGTETQMSPMSWERTSLTEASPGPPPPSAMMGLPGAGVSTCFPSPQNFPV